MGRYRPMEEIKRLRTELAILRAENERLRKALETIRDMDTGPDKLAQSVADYELSGEVAPT